MPDHIASKKGLRIEVRVRPQACPSPGREFWLELGILCPSPWPCLQDGGLAGERRGLLVCGVTGALLRTWCGDPVDLAARTRKLDMASPVT